MLRTYLQNSRFAFSNDALKRYLDRTIPTYRPFLCIGVPLLRGIIGLLNKTLGTSHSGKIVSKRPAGVAELLPVYEERVRRAIVINRANGGLIRYTYRRHPGLVADTIPRS